MGWLSTAFYEITLEISGDVAKLSERDVLRRIGCSHPISTKYASKMADQRWFGIFRLREWS